MTSRPVYQRPASERDIREAARWYAEKGGMPLALRFLAAVAAAREHIGLHPDSGSPMHAFLFPQFPVPLRFKPLQDFDQYLVYYLVYPERVEIIRVWNASRRPRELAQDASSTDPATDLP